MKAAIIAALVAALVATTAASATIAALITGKQIKNGSIGLVDLSGKAKRALKGQRGPAGPQGAPGATGAQGAQGATGAQGAQGVQGVPGLAGVQYVTVTGTVGGGTATANCPAGKFAIAGGGSAGADGWIYSSRPNNNTSWTVGADGGGSPSTVTAFVVCASLTAPPTVGAMEAAGSSSLR
jgi:hypothetical protein